MNSHLLRVIADRLDKGWTSPTSVRQSRGATVVGFEGPVDIEDWTRLFKCGDAEEKMFETSKAEFEILTLNGRWLLRPIVIVRVSKALARV
jgi:hypothetical protein